MTRQTALVTIALLLTFMSTQVVNTSAAAEPVVPPLGSAKFSAQKAKSKGKPAKRHKRRSKKQKNSTAKPSSSQAK